jgi:peptidyl-prolyl cis-trans isomerase SurA
VLEAPGYQATVADWLKFMENRDPQGSEAAYRKLFDNFTSVTALEQYRKNLHIYNPAFAAQLNEFMEGNMLFEIMERRVWGPSGTDTAALRKLYRANPGKYKWDSSEDIISMTGVDSALTESARRTLATSASSWKLITVNSGGNIMADSSRVELKQLGQIPQDLKPGYTSPLVINPDDGSASCFHVLKIYPQPTPRSFDDARGQLIAEQQQILEKKWIDDLKRKYPVKVDEKILEQIIRELAR